MSSFAGELISGAAPRLRRFRLLARVVPVEDPVNLPQQSAEEQEHHQQVRLGVRRADAVLCEVAVEAVAGVPEAVQGPRQGSPDRE